jgi:NDP-sugar pyrophosphorylase family protein
LAEVIERHFAETEFNDVTVRCIRETTALGTAGGFLNAARQSGRTAGGWLVLNGDSLILSHLQPMLQQMNEAKAGAAIMGLEVPDASRYGTLQIGRSGELVRFSEKQSGAGTINAGVYFFRSDVVRQFQARRPLSFEQDVFPELLEKKTRISVTPVSAPFLDIGTEASLKEADAFISTNLKYFQANKPACV